MKNFIRLNSIRSITISGFLFLTVIIVLVAAVSLFLLNRTNEKARIHGHVSQLEIYTLMLFKIDNDFFDLEGTNSNFFQTHESMFLNIRDSLKRQIDIDLATLYNSDAQPHYLTTELQQINKILKSYDSCFKQLDSLVFARGFKDYGVEGRMRYHAHALEKLDDYIDQVDLLSLRRHEKDFLLRNDKDYVDKFDERVALAQQNLNRFETHQAKRAMDHLLAYQKQFHDLIRIQIQIGLTSSDGLKHNLNTSSRLISEKFLNLAIKLYQVSNDARYEATIIYSILILVATIFSIAASVWISGRLSKPIANLSKMVKEYKRKKSKALLEEKIEDAADEIKTLFSAFSQLMDKSEKQMYEIKIKSRQLKEQNTELQKLNKELDNFIYSTAHDLRSPLTSLLGLLNLLKYEDDIVQHQHYHEKMKMSIMRMENFISQIVNYSKNKRLSVTSEPVVLKDLITEIIESNEFIEGASSISWHLDIRETAPAYCDRSRLTIIFNNLISNAVRYADLDKPNPFINIQIRVQESTIYIHFSDNGIGIEKDHLDKVFDMFYRAHSTSKGSGLGLYILKQTVDMLNGFVKVESKVHWGTKFFICIPNDPTFTRAKQVEVVLEEAV